MKQLERVWTKMITKFFQKMDFTLTKTDACIHTINWNLKLLIIDRYVDNL